MNCKHSVGWKPTVKRYNLNAVEETHRMQRKLLEGNWVNGTPAPILILYPKRREGLSIPFKDRVYQRSINDNVLYPCVQRSFIIDNCACQKGKGTDFARQRLKTHLQRYLRKHGVNGYVLQIDIKGYYANMRHDAVKAKFRKHLAEDVYKAVCDVLDTQYSGDVGYNPGSQMVQIAGISLLDDFDHYCKERLHIKHYLRYMDDIFIVHNEINELRVWLDAIREKLNEIGFETHEDKTHITPLSEGFAFLGFEYRMTSTGKILMTLNSANIRHERKKLRRMVSLARRGKMTKAKVDECFQSWCAHASKGNCHSLIQRMTEYFNKLWEEPDDSHSEAFAVDSGDD